MFEQPPFAWNNSSLNKQRFEQTAKKCVNDVGEAKDLGRTYDGAFCSLSFSRNIFPSILYIVIYLYLRFYRHNKTTVSINITLLFFRKSWIVDSGAEEGLSVVVN